MDQPNDAGVDAAIEKYQKTVDVAPRFSLGYARLATAYIRKYRSSQDRAFLSLAAKNADLAFLYNPDSVKAALSRAMVDLDSGNTQQAIELIGKMLQNDPGNPEVLLYKARAFRDLGRLAEAEQVYREIIRQRPNYWPAYNQLGFVLFRNGSYSQAAEAFEQGAHVAPRVALLFNNLGSMYLRLADKDKGAKKKAEESFRQSLERSKNELAYLNLGTMAFETGDYTKALADFVEARNLQPKNDVVWRNIADCYAMLGDQWQVMSNYAEAARVLSEALQVNPQRGASWMTLAFYEAKLSRRDRAEEDLVAAESRGAADLQSQFTKVQALALLGRKEEALRLLIDCLDRGLSPLEVELALDLRVLRSDVRYRRRAAQSNEKR
jgi:tetratricopeptide (TPR) repeat protein